MGVQQQLSKDSRKKHMYSVPHYVCLLPLFPNGEMAMWNADRRMKRFTLFQGAQHFFTGPWINQSFLRGKMLSPQCSQDPNSKEEEEEEELSNKFFLSDNFNSSQLLHRFY